MIPSEIAGIQMSAIKNSMVDLNVGIPCVVVADAEGGAVSVRPSIRKTRMQPDGTKTFERTEIIDEVPIMNIGCGGFVIDIPVKEGCNGYLHFVDYDIDEWQLTGNDVPHTNRVHDQNDCVFIPVFNGGDNEGDCVTIGFEGGTISMCGESITVNVGGSTISIDDNEIALRNGNSEVTVGDGADLVSNGDSLVNTLKGSGRLPPTWG